MKILSIGAHQDDNEFRVGGSAYKWIKAGHEVRFLSMCNGNGGHHLMTPEETSARRAKESARVAEYLGIKYDIWADVDDCTLMPTLEMRQRTIRYIRKFAPDVVISHRPNDYHADHRASAQLVQDASYLLTVPHTCPDTPIMRRMPIILYNEDYFKNPPFTPTFMMDITDVIEHKYIMADMNESQVYEWLPFNKGITVPEGRAERLKWLRGIEITDKTTDEEIISAPYCYAQRFAKGTIIYKDRLVELYGKERASKIRYAESFELCEYGRQPSPEFANELFDI